jgi:hypothetical protein
MKIRVSVVRFRPGHHSRYRSNVSRFVIPAFAYANALGRTNAQ